ncbi:MAG: 16S rRNA (uracil(1498)-N(3))-methyltransferase [Spirochaetaceae bacterium]|jgi:16S rRNA (uracil1498-N3)-methyltransferase|nr:16S rRNA (uracil(1498)-N(3))-methyltransferase [Spirochaetaceae bacterium]
MKRFILTQPPGADGKIRLAGEDYHYLVRVRRLAPGEVFPALLSNGGETLVQVLSVEGGVLTGLCGAEKSGTGSRLPPVFLFQALPKAGKMDLIVRQAAEGGITEIVPFCSEYSVPRLSDEGRGNRLRRWEKIIREARQQSGSSIPTAVKPPLSLEELLDYWETLKSRTGKTLGLLFHQTPLEQKSLHEYLSVEPEMAVLAIGPEGGFSPGEVSRFLEADFRPLTIGDTVLRTETAALYGAAAVRIILLERASWLPKTPLNGSGLPY